MKTLAKEIPFLSANYVSAPVPAYNAVNNYGWTQLGAPGDGVFVYSTYFDLKGLAIDDKTLFFTGATVQDLSVPLSGAGGSSGDNFAMVDLMTTHPLSDLEALQYLTIGNFAAGGGDLTFDQTTYARVRHFNIDIDNAAALFYLTLGDHQTGSLEPTASDRIYCYRVVQFYNTTNSCLISVPSARYLLRAEAKEEAEYEYLMRLKRSYELQQQFDRD